MANADGSIRIEATVSDEQAKKQIAQMSKDIEKQTAAVERQAEKVKKLAAQWEKVSSGGARGLKMKTDLEATEAEAKKLAQQLEEVNAKAYSAQAEYSEKLKQAAVGAIPQEEFSESAQRLNALTAESDRLAEGLRKADEKAAAHFRGGGFFTKCIGDKRMITNPGEKTCRNLANLSNFPLFLFYFTLRKK